MRAKRRTSRRTAVRSGSNLRALPEGYSAGLRPDPSLDSVLTQVRSHGPEVAAVVRQWWTASGFEPLLTVGRQ